MTHLILWRKPVKKTPQALAEEAFALFSIFREAESDFCPNYPTVRRRRDAKPFAWDGESFRKALLGQPVNQGNAQLGELGYSISFFSSLEEKGSVGYRLHTGNRDPKFVDTFVVDIPEAAGSSRLFSPETVEDTFRRCIAVFRPFWGCVDDRGPLEGGYLTGDRKRPRSICWLNYWDAAMALRVGPLRIRRACGAVPEASWRDGVLRTGREPLSRTPERAEILNRLLGLNAFTGSGEAVSPRVGQRDNYD